MASPPLGRSALTDLSFYALSSCSCQSELRDFCVDNVQWPLLNVLCPLDSLLGAQILMISKSPKLTSSLTITIDLVVLRSQEIKLYTNEFYALGAALK